ncbi:NADH-quinone oxidoreductase subunit J [Aliiglaciecola sp. CAU 1673]|uniref:NADH-quinone oxidoreductase subunit J n=1 Tax=Aliiglaciecola sp. CAU 1673 TaxID=3032595 RepID=UPI0023DA5E98|nr:NADH-quinone oxidoreductase subunit J [Aliiglaciecola sp. CAU 1673]MDF2176655.1 NADH-quinone oxidoreductase subunit J [Aliiglaciecola sp. CAU 1673]
MQWLFYIAGAVALFASLRAVCHRHAVHALLYLVVSLLALAMCFYLLGAPFAAALQIIVYAGAIMVLFVFAVMLFNITDKDIERERQWIRWQVWVGPTLLVLLLLAEVVMLIQLQPAGAQQEVQLIEAKTVGGLLFGPYLLAVEIASFLLLAALVGGYHLAKALGRPHDGAP